MDIHIYKLLTFDLQRTAVLILFKVKVFEVMIGIISVHTGLTELVANL